MLDVGNLVFGVGEQLILNELSFKASSGERLGIIGPNGSGKTTMFNCLSGFNILKSGTINFFNESVEKYSPSTRANLGFGRLFQNFGIFREMTVGENILVALESKSVKGFGGFFSSKNKFKPQILEYLTKVGLESKIDQKAGSLSGGQLRLLEIIRLIAFGAKLFLLDEPTAGVSPKMKGQILKALTDLVPKDAIVLLIEHDINFIQGFCERVLVLDSGRVVLDGSVAEVRNDKRLQEIYFGTND